MFILELFCFFYDPSDVGKLISGSSAFSESSLYIWKILVHTLLKPSLEDFDHDLASMWNECNCMVVWTFFGIALLWEWNKNWSFPVLWPLLSFPTLLIYSCDVLNLVQLCDTMDCGPSAFSVHGIFWARILECIAISYSTVSSWPGGGTCISWVSCIGRQTFYHCAS